MVESVRMAGVIPLWLLCYYVTRCANIGECEDGWGDTSMATLVLGVLMVESVRMAGVIPLWLLCY